MKILTLHKITFAVLITLITSAVGYTGVSWCEHSEEQLGQHLVLDNPGDSPYALHGSSDDSGGQECPGCVHFSAIDVADHSGGMSLDQIPAPSLSAAFEDPSSLQSIAEWGDFSVSNPIPANYSPPKDTQLLALRTVSLLI